MWMCGQIGRKLYLKSFSVMVDERKGILKTIKRWIDHMILYEDVGGHWT